MVTRKYFCPAEFVAVFSAYALPNTRASITAANITGNLLADDRIRSIAHEHGYTLHPVAVGELTVVDGYQLQPMAAQAWGRLKANAASSGINLKLLSGFRSLRKQQSLFIGRLEHEGVIRIGRAYGTEEVADGVADDAVRSVLSSTAPSGYSKHHTGYALDLHDAASDLPFTQFKQTSAYRWLAANNFAQAKVCGFIPSYPRGVPNLGPRPEAWEVVWVGTRRLQAARPWRTLT